jgi:hypothetical protein
MPSDPGRRISAAAVGRYTFCARAWWLQYVRGLEPTNRVALERGERAHDAHGRQVAQSGRSLAASRWLLWLALLLAAALLLIWLAYR